MPICLIFYPQSTCFCLFAKLFMKLLVAGRQLAQSQQQHPQQQQPRLSGWQPLPRRQRTGGGTPCSVGYASPPSPCSTRAEGSPPTETARQQPPLQQPQQQLQQLLRNSQRGGELQQRLPGKIGEFKNQPRPCRVFILCPKNISSPATLCYVRRKSWNNNNEEIDSFKS